MKKIIYSSTVLNYMNVISCVEIYSTERIYSLSMNLLYEQICDMCVHVWCVWQSGFHTQASDLCTCMCVHIQYVCIHTVSVSGVLTKYRVIPPKDTLLLYTHTHTHHTRRHTFKI